MTTPIKTPKKLIEVALPLDAINKAAAREKSIRHGHPSTLHLWWARRPLAAARAVIFAQMVDDPSEYIEGDRRTRAWKEAVSAERERLFKLIEDLVQWENTNNEEVLERARAEIRKSWQRTCALNARHPRAAELFDPAKLPAFHDPFAGGGTLPLEAQRLGLEAYASDLNPVAVTINKAMIEIPPRFAGRPPVHPPSPSGSGTGGEGGLFAREWKGAQGLAEDVRYYGQWMRDEAERRIGHLYPKVEITYELVAERPDLKPLLGQKLTVIAWLWARTIKSPNPAFSHVEVPLASTFVLSSKAGKEAYVEPVIFPSPPSHDGGRQPPTQPPPAGGRGDPIAPFPGGGSLSQPSPNREGPGWDMGICPCRKLPTQPSPSGGGLGWGNYRFTVRVAGGPGFSREGYERAKSGTKLARGANFRCLMSGVPIGDPYIKAESMAGRMGARLMAIVAEGPRGRVYLPPLPEHEAVARSAQPTWKPDQPMNRDTRDLVSGRGYGFFTWADLFTPRQLVALTTFSDLVGEAIEKCRQDAVAAGIGSSPRQGDAPTPTLPRWGRESLGNNPSLQQGEARMGAMPSTPTLPCWGRENSVNDPSPQREQIGFTNPFPQRGEAEFTNPFPQRRKIELANSSPQRGKTELTNPSPQRGEARRGVRSPTPSLPRWGEDLPLDAGGTGALAYAQAVGVYLAFAVDYAANYWSVIATPADGFIRGTFARQALPMTWDFAEAPPFGNTSGNWMAGIE